MSRASQSEFTLEQSIFRTLLYFDLFQYPLRSEEVFRFLGTNGIELRDVDHALDTLTRQGRVHRFADLYGLSADEHPAQRRRRGNILAHRMASLAHRRGRFIGAFPFVRAVMASGSFSKGYMDENSDLDFFVVTVPGRLWIARMLIAIYKRVFLLNNHKYCCCNYFITEDHLEIEEKNLFTATELATLVPVCGRSVYRRLMRANSWVSEYFPNFRVTVPDIPEVRSSLIKRSVEVALAGKAGEALTRFFRMLTLKRWQRLYARQYPLADFELAFKSTALVSKNHPNHFQRHILERYDARLRDFSATMLVNES
ncbi:MAG TPA: hypothetical protein VKZ86_09405 [Cyclobacteriaceae bacterium]|nr:hypothetical protein [Cyclobacteriaceae bacterium]